MLSKVFLDVCTGSCSKASCAASAQPDGSSTPAAPGAKSTSVLLSTCSSQEEATKLPSSSQTFAEPAPSSTQDNETVSSALYMATKQPSLAASSGKQGTAAMGASAMPAGKTAKPAETGLPVRRRQRKPASPRSGMPRADIDMPAPGKPGMQRTHTGSHTQPLPGVQKQQPTQKCRKGLENQAPQTTATAQPKARSRRKTWAAEQQTGGRGHSIEPINVAGTPPQTRSRKRARAALAEMKNGGTAAAAVATAGQATMTAADISTRGIEEEGTPAKRRRDAAATTEAQTLPQHIGGSAERQTPSSSAASACEHEAQQPADMDVDSAPTAEAKLPAPARGSRPRGRGAKRGRKAGKAASAVAVPTAPSKDCAPPTDVEVDRTTTAAASQIRIVLRIRRNTNANISLENCPPSPLMVKMPQAPRPQVSSLGKPACALQSVSVYLLKTKATAVAV